MKGAGFSVDEGPAFFWSSFLDRIYKIYKTLTHLFIFFSILTILTILTILLILSKKVLLNPV